MGREGELLVRVRAPAIDGRANEAVLALLAEQLGLRRSRVCLIRGATSRRKLVVIAGLDEAEVRQRLQKSSAE